MYYLPVCKQDPCERYPYKMHITLWQWKSCKCSGSRNSTKNLSLIKHQNKEKKGSRFKSFPGVPLFALTSISGD